MLFVERESAENFEDKRSEADFILNISICLNFFSIMYSQEASRGEKSSAFQKGRIGTNINMSITLYYQDILIVIDIDNKRSL